MKPSQPLHTPAPTQGLKHPKGRLSSICVHSPFHGELSASLCRYEVSALNPPALGRSRSSDFALRAAGTEWSQAP